MYVSLFIIFSNKVRLCTHTHSTTTVILSVSSSVLQPWPGLARPMLHVHAMHVCLAYMYVSVCSVPCFFFYVNLFFFFSGVRFGICGAVCAKVR